MIDYFTNLKTDHDQARAREYLKLQQAFGYLPVYGPTMPDVTLGKKLLADILRDYPGYRWVIEVRDTVITVVNETLAKDWGFRLKEKMLDNDGHVIRSFAGKLLEQYGLQRGGVNPEELSEKARDLRGNVVRTA